MTKDEIEFVKQEIEKAWKDTPYGKAITMPWLILKDAIKDAERLNWLNEKAVVAWKTKNSLDAAMDKCTNQPIREAIDAAMNNEIKPTTEQNHHRQEDQEEIARQKGFGMLPLKAEGKAAHPDAYGIGYDNGDKFGDDEHYLKQLRAYAAWRGAEETKEESCSRPHLLERL